MESHVVFVLFLFSPWRVIVLTGRIQVEYKLGRNIGRAHNKKGRKHITKAS